MVSGKDRILGLPGRVRGIVDHWFRPEGLTGRINRIRCDRFYGKRPLPNYSSNRWVLIDGLWDNPNHWTRTWMVGTVVCGEYQASPLGLVYEDERRAIVRSMKSIGVSRFEILRKIVSPFEGESRKLTEQLLAPLGRGEDLLEASLPHGVPVSRLYDEVLKRQRNARLNLAHPNLRLNVFRFVHNLLQLHDVLEKYDVEAVVSSHTIGKAHSSLTWLAVSKGIPFYLTDNASGKLRISRVDTKEDYFSPSDTPDVAFRDSLEPEVRNQLVEIGRRVLAERISCKSIDLAGRLAYRTDRRVESKSELCGRFGWDEKLPLYCVMMSNWFDFPHTFGMTNFENIEDWLRTLLGVIHDQNDLLWLIKPHPAEHRWYGGPSIEEVIGNDLPSHIQILPKDVHSVTVLQNVEGIVTPYGTCGLEYAASGKKVLLADRSFYSEWGFCTTPQSRQEFVERLRRLPLGPAPTKKQVEDALLYIALYMAPAVGTPAGYLYPCDTGIYEIFSTLPDFLRRNERMFTMEMDEIRAWLKTDYRSFHAFKAVRAATDRSATVSHAIS